MNRVRTAIAIRSSVRVRAAGLSPPTARSRAFLDWRSHSISLSHRWARLDATSASTAQREEAAEAGGKQTQGSGFRYSGAEA